MIRFLANRIFQILPTLLGVVTLTFLLLHLTPGDPVEVLLGEHALPSDRQELRASLGLDQPILHQYIHFLTGLLQGDLGISFYSGKDVTALILSRLPATVELALAAIVFACSMAFILGVSAAAFKGQWPDKISRIFSMAGFSMPSFWIGPLLIIVFSLWLGWLPVSGKEGWQSLILPAVTLGTAMAAFTSRLIRNGLLETLSSDYIRTAKAKGCTRAQVLLRHAWRNTLLPVVTVVFLQAGALLTGAILTEAVFSWPGLGSLVVEALHQRDYPVIQGCVLFIAFVYMFMTFLSDITYALLDPRVRYGENSS